MSKLLVCGLIVVSTFATETPALAQRDSGDILGTVRDDSGGVLLAQRQCSMASAMVVTGACAVALPPSSNVIVSATFF